MKNEIYYDVIQFANGEAYVQVYKKNKSWNLHMRIFNKKSHKVSQYLTAQGFKTKQDAISAINKEQIEFYINQKGN